MGSDTSPTVDGRRARRERSRAAVINALFALVADGKVPPSVELVAERSGVSVSSIFRMFDGLDDMREQAFAEFEKRYAHLFGVVFDESTNRGDRIDVFVRTRVELYEAAGSLMSLARQRALDNEPIADRVSAQRMRFADQAQRCFRTETNKLTPTEAANFVALVDAATSPETFELLQASHARTRRQIEHVWRRAVEALANEWCAPQKPARSGERR